MNRIEERALVARACDGDARAFELLWTAHFRMCRNAAYAMGARGGMEDDMAQAAMILAWSKLSAFRGDSSFGAWLRSILRNVILESHRSAYSRHAMPSYDALLPADREALLRDDHTPEAQYGGAEFERLIVREIQRLPRPYAEILLTPRDQLGLSDSAAKCRMCRARRELRRRLARHLPRRQRLTANSS